MSKLLNKNVVSICDHDTVLATIEVSANAERIFQALTTQENEIWWGSADVYTTVNWNADEPAV